MSKVSINPKNVVKDPLLTKAGVLAGMIYPVLEYLKFNHTTGASPWVTIGLIITGALIGRKPKTEPEKK